MLQYEKPNPYRTLLKILFWCILPQVSRQFASTGYTNGKQSYKNYSYSISDDIKGPTLPGTSVSGSFRASNTYWLCITHSKLRNNRTLVDKVGMYILIVHRYLLVCNILPLHINVKSGGGGGDASPSRKSAGDVT